ncbi:hypothetical protein N8368_05010 [Bacteroidia bacterium]|nr:hypothetical protein [Bacteroidia bacterium]MDC1395847.1 hypothetical protein [Bacteroidia bacterium]
MNISKFLFKLLIILSYILRVTLILLPITWIIVTTKEGGWRYGFTFIQNNFEVALFVAFAVGFLVALYHAVSFEEIEGAPDENYLKTSQEVIVKDTMHLDLLEEKMRKQTNRYKRVSRKGDSIVAQRKVHFLPPDVMTLTKKNDLFEITSRPFSPVWFIDFGRNFKNVKEIAKLIKLEE